MTVNGRTPTACFVVLMRSPRVRAKVYTVAQLAQAFAISPRLVRTLIKRGELPALRIGRSYRIPRKVVAEYLARALLSPPRSCSKPRVRAADEHTGYLFPLGPLQQPEAAMAIRTTDGKVSTSALIRGTTPTA